MFDFKKAALVVFTYPDGQWGHSNVNWLHQCKFDAIITEMDGDEMCARNKQAGLVHTLPKHITHLVWIDADQAPTDSHSSMQHFLESEADVVFCLTDCRNPAAYANPAHGHVGIMKMRREVLEKLWEESTDDNPVFLYEYVARGTKRKACLCERFAEKVRQAGFTINRAGYCWHDNPRVHAKGMSCAQ
jgi:hypothetical protein